MTNSQCSDVHVNMIVQSLVATLRQLPAAPGQSFDSMESTLLTVANEAVRIALEAELQARANGFAEHLRVDSREYRRHESGRVQYHSLCGPLWVERATYRRVGERNGPTIVPLDLEAGIVQRATPALASAVTQWHADAPSREVERQMKAAHRRPPSRSTLDRMARELGIRFKQLLPTIEPVVRSQEELPDGARGLCLGLDRTTVPMEETDGERVRVQYRMAYIGTVSITGEEGKALVTRRYVAPAHEGRTKSSKE